MRTPFLNGPANCSKKSSGRRRYCDLETKETICWRPSNRRRSIDRDAARQRTPIWKDAAPRSPPCTEWKRPVGWCSMGSRPASRFVTAWFTVDRSRHLRTDAATQASEPRRGSIASQRRWLAGSAPALLRGLAQTRLEIRNGRCSARHFGIGFLKPRRVSFEFCEYAA